MIWTALYVLFIVMVNWLFMVVPPWPTPLGDLYLANIVVGAIFVLRDYAQREVGHKILLFTLIAGIITWYMVDPALATASIIAFFLSETADWAVYSFTRRPLQKRILISSLIAVPLDTLAFQYLANYLTPAAFSTEVMSKAIGVFAVWWLLKQRELRALAPQ